MRIFQAYILEKSTIGGIYKLSYLFPMKKIQNVPGETGEDIAKIEGYSISPNTGLHSTFKILPISSCLGQ